MKYTASHVLGSQRNGLNHVSMNMGDFPATGPVRGTNYPTYSDALLNWYQVKQVKSVRLMFTWEAVQSTLGGPVPPGGGFADYWTDLTGVIARLLARGIYVMLSPWQYNSNSGDTDIVYDDAAFTPAQFADFWSKLASQINLATGNDQRVSFDLINEPHTHAESGNRPGDIGISLADWFACAQAAITAIRAAGAGNTIFVPGMAYTAASTFTTNGSAGAWLGLADPLNNIAVSVHCYTGLGSTNPTVLPDACSALVAWARTQAVKVNIGEIAINAGPNGRPAFCGTFANAQTQWANWNAFCVANADVLVGWNWWANSAAGGWWNEGDSCDPAGYHWGLTLNDGVAQTIYMDLIESTLPAPNLTIRDNTADAGAEPNPTTGVGWESPDIWVTQPGMAGGAIMGGAPATVNVLVRNTGAGTFPAGGGHVVRLFWAKASAGLSWPAPWDGSVPGPPPQGGSFTPVALNPIAAGGSQTVSFDWAATPRPQDYVNNDGHFCLLAFVTPAVAADFDGFAGADLNVNVLRFSDVAWRNIHILPAAMKKLGNLVVANHTRRVMRAQVSFDVLDERGAAVNAAGTLTLAPTGRALDRIRELRTDRPWVEEIGQGLFRLRDIAIGIPRLELQPDEVLVFELTYDPGRETKAHAVRASQSAYEDGVYTRIGGQTFVAGEVEGFVPSSRQPYSSADSAD